MRMVPQINSSFEIIQDAEKVRGVNIEKMNLIQRLRNYVPLLVPLILAMLRSSDTMDIALESRGFGHQEERTSIDEATFRRIDYISFIVLTAILIYCIISNMLWGQLIPITLPFSL
jgi:energy-coupling factor transport system permease protein